MHGAFSAEEVDFMVEPYGDEQSFRASLVLYESFFDPEKMSDIPKLGEPHDVRTLILYGTEDRVVGPAFSRRMQLACSDYAGPFVIERGGHYLQYERAEVFNEAVQMFCQDLLTPRASPRGTQTPSLG
jgi:pimeloyl-ACP methyl ester carboxylesterase